MVDIAALTTIFTPSPGCTGRYAIFIDHGGPIDGTRSEPPTSGWIDPSFTSCIPAQYTNTFPTFSPGVCPDHMSIASYTSSVDGASARTVWTGACCQSGFSTMEIDPRFYCTSSVTTQMAFLLDPNISTTDIYTTLSNLWIEHDQVTVEWEQADLAILPGTVATQYASIMGIGPPMSQPESTAPTSSSLEASALPSTQQPPVTSLAGSSTTSATSLQTTAAPRTTQDTLVSSAPGAGTVGSSDWTVEISSTESPTLTQSLAQASQSTSKSPARSLLPLGWMRWMACAIILAFNA
ncbi:uncharacterized protein BCR38DRAFT_411262 [Pseudomassariella vexata]|uniref:Uncharacterized protein n=1 Tax=Pseudomassariella vexata TaxID=1141098 RepID=A0A1Y2DQ13_9PEZI|nr:uncharacterized protein BCR38DRAFT_411262 [Pseudomassariella vexata]ORY61383.1 hypothetical protein BCR38DRAFT_411262 [Pseudomassariella vexata]